MNNEEDWLDIDDTEAIKNIRQALPEDVSAKLTDTQIEEIIDCVFDYFTGNNLFDEESDNDAFVEVDENELLAYVTKNISSTVKKALTDDELLLVIDAELNNSDLI